VDTVADHKNNYFIGRIFVDLISNYHIKSNFDWFDDYYTILKIKKRGRLKIYSRRIILIYNMLKFIKIYLKKIKNKKTILNPHFS